jgi:general transcription factor 3C polypeptide 5 (transcription factor C subunit 1)
MFKSGPFRDAYVIFGLDPRKEQKWAKYQTAIFNFRTGKWRNRTVVQENVEGLWKGRENHLFTGKELYNKVVAYGFIDILDPMLRRLLDESPLREKFHVCSFEKKIVLIGRIMMGGILRKLWSRLRRL